MSELRCPDWRRSRAGQLYSGTIRGRVQDFRVDEILGFEFSGDGEHDFLLIEKVGANTSWVARQLAEHAGVAERDVGYAGMKDRHAVTSQWFSVRRPAGANADWAVFAADGVRIMQCERNRRKLKKGAHVGNRFEIAVRDTGPLPSEQRERLDEIASTGVPNYFGEQRFGRAGANMTLATDLFSGRRMSRAKRGLALSSARSFLFNHILERRVADGSWDQLQAGDCASLQGSGSIFAVAVVDEELRERCLLQDIHPSGALWGKGELASRDAIAALEESIVSQYPEIRDGLQCYTNQSRRALRLKVQNFEWRYEVDVLNLSFELGRGGFATAVLREIVNYEDLAAASRST